MLFLLSCLIIAGITAEDPRRRYHKVNSSSCWKVGKSPPFEDSRWIFNQNRIIVMNGMIMSNYTDKVDYDPNNYSLCIKKLTEADSGIYTFSFVKSGFMTAETHRLIVEGPVPKPVIKMSALHYNLSAALCNITVNCSIQDAWVSSVCDEDSCRTSQRSLGKVNITIFTNNRSIVCNGNNNVSTSNVSESMEAMCFRKSNPEHEETPDPLTVMEIVIIIAVSVSLCVFTVCVAKGLCSTQYNRHQADTSTAQTVQVEAQPQSVPRVSSSSSSQADACYENVDDIRPCQTTSPTTSPREGLESKQSQKVDTVYSILQAPNVTSSPGKSDSSEDTKGHKKTQEASTSQCVSQHESEHPAQIDTLYSVLQRPKNLKS